VSFEIPEGYVGLVWPRSGLSVKRGIDVLAGVIDSGYRGEVRVCLYNTSHDWLEVKEGDRIAQILFQEVPQFQLQEVDILQNSDRGEGGFGSSGK
jgi:dUTP pyrophosphatase